MAQLQLAFDKAAEVHNRKLELNKQLKDILASNLEFTEIEEKLTVIKTRKNEILNEIKAANNDLFFELAQMASEEKNEKELMSDLALNQLVAGETVEVKDQDGNLLEPVFSVKFVKAK